MKTAKQSFHMTRWLMLMHHHLMLGYKSLNRSEDIVWTNIQWSLGPLLWPCPWTQHSNPFRTHTSLWWCTTVVSLVAKGSKETIVFWLYEPCDFGHDCSLAVSFSAWDSRSWWCTNFGNKKLTVPKVSCTNKTEILTLHYDPDLEHNNPI